jgi:hypothetical protein
LEGKGFLKTLVLAKLRDIMRLHIRGPVYDITGYAHLTRETALAFYRQGVEIYLQPITWAATSLNLPKETNKILDELKLWKGKCDYLLSIGIPPFFHMKGQYKRTIGLTMLEVDGIPGKWVEICNKMDEIWVPSTFNEDTFIKSGVQGEKVVVMPLGVDTGTFNPHGPRAVTGKGFTFLTVCEWIPRKGYDILVDAYLQEFSDKDNVSLVIKSHGRRNFDPDGTKILQEIKGFIGKSSKLSVPSIALISRILTTSQMAALYRSVDCFVLPTRGEGWNLPVLEAMASEIPVITTAWSGHMDFLNEENSYLIKVKELEPVPRLGLSTDEIYLGFRWAKPDVQHLRKLLREVYENRTEAFKKAKKARESIKRLSWDAVAERMVERLSLGGR